MMKVEVVSNGQLIVSPEYDGEVYDEADEIKRAFDRMMVALLGMDEVEDPSVSGSLASGEIEVALTVKAESQESALEQANAAIHRAFHAADVRTPDWHSARKGLESRVAYRWHETRLEEAVAV